MSATCANCGHPDCQPNDRFCIKCGRRLAAGGTPEQQLATVTMRMADAAFVQVKLGTVYRKKGNRDAALRAFRKALEIDPACAAAQTALDEMTVETGGAVDGSLRPTGSDT